MAQHWRQVNGFRFGVVIMLSFLAAMMFNLDDGAISITELLRTTTQALIAGFAFLQCPESPTKEKI